MNLCASRAKMCCAFVFVLISMAVPGSVLKAQTRDAVLRIEVRDPSGHGMKALGELRNLSTGSELKFSTDGRGGSRFSGLTAGRYRIEVSKSGFATQSVTLELKTGVETARIFSMTLAPVASKIDVIAP